MKKISYCGCLRFTFLLAFILLFSITSLALIPGDFGSADNGLPDGVVDFEDLMIFAMAYGTTPSDDNWNEVCDIASQGGVLQPDGIIDFEDLMIFAMNYGQRDVVTKITVANEYINTTTGVTYVKGSDTVTVTFPESVDPDYIVEVAQKIENAGIISYVHEVATTPNTDRKVWVATYDFTITVDNDCEAICLVVLVKHPCCPGEEVALKVVTVDYIGPYVNLFVTVKDCDDLIFSGAYFEWTSRTTSTDITFDCCGDDCSGFAYWSIVVDPDPYLGPCDFVTGISCPVEGAIECGCIAYADTETNNVEHTIKFALVDNVGNVGESTWILTFDTDSLVSFTVENTPIMALDGVYQVLDGGCE
jgi:hypothetical protein